MSFNSAKYNGTKGSLIDVTDDYANKNFVISFYHLISKKTISFKAYVTNFNDTYNSNYASETVFGRADPIQSFKSTTRQISLGFKAPASSIGEGYENLAKTQQLIQFLYPAYIEANSSLTIAQTPLVRLKVMNVLGNSSAMSISDPTDSFSTVYSSYGSSSDSTTGLLGVISNLTVLHGLESDAGVFIKSDGVVIPRVIEVSLNFSPIHQHTVGWQDENTFYEPAFPYGAQIGGEPQIEDEAVPVTDNQIATSEEEAASSDDVQTETSDAVSESGVAENAEVSPSYLNNRLDFDDSTSAQDISRSRGGE